MKNSYTQSITVTGGIGVLFHIEDVPKWIFDACNGDRCKAEEEIKNALNTLVDVIFKDLKIIKTDIAGPPMQPTTTTMNIFDKDR